MEFTIDNLFIFYSDHFHNFNAILYFLFIVSVYLSYNIGKSVNKELTSQKHVYNSYESYESEKKHFLNLFQKNDSFVNSNIHPDIFIYEKYQQILKDENNSYEKQWKSRILIQTIDHKNVIMYYDLFKHCFSYFSDFQLTYNLLNQVAMKYVRFFYCRDFFIDNTIIPDNFESPLIKIKEDIIKQERIDYQKKKNNINIDFNSDVFLKPKKKQDKINNDPENSLPDNEKIIYRNNFCYCGKIQNFHPINNTQHNNKNKNKLSYKDFKNNKIN